MRLPKIVWLTMIALPLLLAAPGCHDTRPPLHTPYTQYAMVAPMPSNYGDTPYYGHCIDQVRLRMLINEIVEFIAINGGEVTSFKVRYGWRDTDMPGPAVVAVIRLPAGNTAEFVDYTAVNPNIIALDEVETCPAGGD